MANDSLLGVGIFVVVVVVACVCFLCVLVFCVLVCVWWEGFCSYVPEVLRHFRYYIPCKQSLSVRL